MSESESVPWSKRVINCVCGCEIKQGGLSIHLTSRKHVERIAEMPEIAEKRKPRSEKLKEYHALWTKTRITCSCGKELSKGGITYHLSTELHKNAMIGKEEIAIDSVEPRHECEICGVFVTERGRARHETSKKHIVAITQ